MNKRIKGLIFRFKRKKSHSLAFSVEVYRQLLGTYFPSLRISYYHIHVCGARVPLSTTSMFVGHGSHSLPQPCLWGTGPTLYHSHVCGARVSISNTSMFVGHGSQSLTHPCLWGTGLNLYHSHVCGARVSISNTMSVGHGSHSLPQCLWGTGLSTTSMFVGHGSHSLPHPCLCGTGLNLYHNHVCGARVPLSTTAMFVGHVSQSLPQQCLWGMVVTLYHCHLCGVWVLLLGFLRPLFTQNG